MLGFVPAGTGEHDFLWIEKEGANTAWVAENLARHAGVRDVDVGYAGRKDRNAVTRQWFSVRRPTGQGTAWATFDLPGVRILDIDRHDRKLRRGAHRGNGFHIAIRGMTADLQEIDPWLQIIRNCGVPNYFGEQRFGRNGANMLLAQEIIAGKRVQRNKRNIGISAARSFLFNEILQLRISKQCWDSALEGDVFNLDGTNSTFPDDGERIDLDRRLQSMDIHPTAGLWGCGAPACIGKAAALELEIAREFENLSKGIERHGVNQGRRATRMAVRDLHAKRDGDMLWLDFSLGKGGYATAVLREIMA
jgi:tRNA pseudouridine13 synthase